MAAPTSAANVTCATEGCMRDAERRYSGQLVQVSVSGASFEATIAQIAGADISGTYESILTLA